MYKKSILAIEMKEDLRAHRSLSIPFHSRTIVVQNPLRKAREAVVLVIAKISSASSPAKACCTSGLSDIQKPTGLQRVKAHLNYRDTQ